MHREGGSSLFRRYVNCVIPNLLAIIVCACLITFCSREPLSPSMADREEEVALQSSEEKGSGQDMGVPNQVSAIRCVSGGTECKWVYKYSEQMLPALNV